MGDVVFRNELLQNVRDIIEKMEPVENIPTMQEVIPESNFFEFTVEDEIVYLQTYPNLNYYRNLNVGNAISNFIKRVIRKCIKFYVEPIAKEQSNYNAHVATTFYKMQRKVDENELMIKMLKEQVDLLNKENQKVLNKINEINNEKSGG